VAGAVAGALALALAVDVLVGVAADIAVAGDVAVDNEAIHDATGYHGLGHEVLSVLSQARVNAEASQRAWYSMLPVAKPRFVSQLDEGLGTGGDVPHTPDEALHTDDEVLLVAQQKARATVRMRA
jgi:hypothetical protein